MPMEGPLEERDWKFMRRIHDEMLHVLCRRINCRAVEIAGRELGNPHEQYLELFTHVRGSDRIVADCFNDWRRSNIHRKILALREHNLLPDAYVKELSSAAQEWLAWIEKRDDS